MIISGVNGTSGALTAHSNFETATCCFTLYGNKNLLPATYAIHKVSQTHKKFLQRG